MNPLYRMILCASLLSQAASAETIVIESALPSQLPQSPFAEYAEQAKATASDKLLDTAIESGKAGKIEQTIALLQRAALEQECTVTQVSEEKSFDTLRSDARWEKLRTFLEQSEKAWPQSSFTREVLTLPSGYDGKKALPLVIGLHGFGSLPEDFSGADHQLLADQLQIAFLSVSGKTALGRQSFMWSPRYEDDWKHVEAAIERSRKHLTIAPGQLMAIGFSQGGALAADLCAAHPEMFRGCIVMSPGSRNGSRLNEAVAAAKSAHGQQQYFFSWISGEGEGTKQRSRESKVLLEKHDATVFIHEFPGKGHQFPRAYADYFAIALQVIMKNR